MAANLQKRMKKLFSEELLNKKDDNVIKDKTNIVYDFGETKTIKKPNTFAQVFFNQKGLELEQIKKQKVQYHKKFVKIKEKILDNIAKENIKIHNNKDKNKEIDPKKIEYIKTIKYLEKTFTAKKHKIKPDFLPFKNLDNYEERTLKKNKSQERLGSFRQKVILPVRDYILNQQTERPEVISDESNIEYTINETKNEITVKKFNIPRNKSIDFDNLNINYDKFSSHGKHHKKYDDVLAYLQDKEKEKEKYKEMANKKKRNFTTSNLFTKVNKLHSQNKNEIFKLNFPPVDEGNSLKVLSFLNSKFGFYKKNNSKINALSQEYINLVSKADFPVKTIFYIEKHK